ASKASVSPRSRHRVPDDFDRRFGLHRALIFMTRFSLILALAFTACTDDNVDTSQYAIDVDHSGAFDCADLDNVHACIDHHIVDTCALADINDDGVIDSLDVHDIAAALHDHGIVCSTH